jgi:hypothetical protein
MSTRALALMLVVTVLVGGALVSCSDPTSRRHASAVGIPHRDRPSRNSPRNGKPGRHLNAWARQGWELVGMTRREVRVDDALMTETIYTFKRPAEQ